MSRSNKIFNFVFIILLIITGAELYYFFFYQPDKTKRTTTSTNKPCINCNITPSNNTSPETLAIDQTNIDYLKTIPKDNWQFFLLQEIMGYVANLKIEGDQIKYDLVDEKNQTIEKFAGSINQAKFPRKIFIQKGEDKTLTDNHAYLNLKNGEKIKITRYYDLSKPNNSNLLFNELIIFK